jgi:hypothetical protein
MNCFTLQRKGSTENVNFSEVDNEICKHFGVTPDPKLYYKKWYVFIGLGLATMYKLGTPEFVQWCNEIKEDGLDELYQIGMYLNENFTSNSWAER